jgi:hypothetical protein
VPDVNFPHDGRMDAWDSVLVYSGPRLRTTLATNLGQFCGPARNQLSMAIMAREVLHPIRAVAERLVFAAFRNLSGGRPPIRPSRESTEPAPFPQHFGRLGG